MFFIVYLRRPESTLKLATAEYFQHDLHGNYPVCTVHDIEIWRKSAQLNDINLRY
jgi:hypothetical protein